MERSINDKGKYQLRHPKRTRIDVDVRNRAPGTPKLEFAIALLKVTLAVMFFSPASVHTTNTQYTHPSSPAPIPLHHVAQWVGAVPSDRQGLHTNTS